MHGLTEPAPAPILRWGKRAYGYHGSNLGTGNRCNHDPESLAVMRLALPSTKDGFRVKILDTLIKKAQAYFLDPESVPLLAYLDKKKNRDGSYRQNRSEGREAQSLVMCAIFAALDLKSLRVGTYTLRGEFKNLSFDELARRCGLTKPSKDPAQPEPVASSRFWRAIAWLKRAGVIEVFEQYEETTDGKRGRPAIKTVSQAFIRTLGKFTRNALKTARDKAHQKVTKFLNGAVLGGVLSKAEDEQLTHELQQEAMRKQMRQTPTLKNQRPKTVPRDNDTTALKNDYKAYTVALMERISSGLGRPVRGLAESQRLFKEFGGLSEPEWLLRRTE